ncbi:MAG: hypothetical protein MJ141_00880 [Clostridia bacterium]|nr:hypothetical protein [Clostridia bacterium]
MKYQNMRRLRILFWILILAVLAGCVTTFCLWRSRLKKGVPFERTYEMYLIPAGEEQPSGERVTLTLSEGTLCRDIFADRIIEYRGRAEMGDYLKSDDFTVFFHEFYGNQYGVFFLEGENKYSPLYPIVYLRPKDGLLLLTGRGDEEGGDAFCLVSAPLSRGELDSIFFSNISPQ